MYSIDTITEAIKKLPITEQNKLFELIDNNAELLGKIFYGLPILDFINEGIDTQHEMINLYIYWKSNR